MTPLPYSDERHQRAHQFLVEEAHLLDTSDFEGWLELMHPTILYRMPVRVTAVKTTPEESVQTMDHFNEDLYSLRKRVARFQTDHAWTEDPQSRLRHHVSNIRTFAGGDGLGEGADLGATDEADGSGAGAAGTATGGAGADTTGALRVESAVLLYRSRGDRTPPSMLSAGRADTLVDVDGQLLLAERVIEIDDAVLRTQNLAIFL